MKMVIVNSMQQINNFFPNKNLVIIIFVQSNQTQMNLRHNIHKVI